MHVKRFELCLLLTSLCRQIPTGLGPTVTSNSSGGSQAALNNPEPLILLILER